MHLLLSGPFARSITRSYPFRMLRAHTRQQGPSARLQITSDQSPGLLLGEFPDATDIRSLPGRACPFQLIAELSQCHPLNRVVHGSDRRVLIASRQGAASAESLPTCLGRVGPLVDGVRRLLLEWLTSEAQRCFRGDVGLTKANLINRVPEVPWDHSLRGDENA